MILQKSVIIIINFVEINLEINTVESSSAASVSVKCNLSCVLWKRQDCCWSISTSVQKTTGTTIPTTSSALFSPLLPNAQLLFKVTLSHTNTHTLKREREREPYKINMTLCSSLSMLQGRQDIFGDKFLSLSFLFSLSE